MPRLFCHVSFKLYISCGISTFPYPSSLSELSHICNILDTVNIIPDAILRLTETVTSQNKQPPCLNKGGARIFHVDTIILHSPPFLKNMLLTFDLKLI